ncbi:MAG: triose-phosphate isomerase [candidate division Zixibacteria bacterium]|nr:triose-phosphate isomerase [candidate division Zixibacteria bacterium]
MRDKIIAGNWKMNTTVDDAVKLATEIKARLTGFKDAILLICPPDVNLYPVQKIIEKSVIKLGAQNMHYEKSGAYTGETSGEMLKSIGCDYVIVGHSERRAMFGDTDVVVRKKLQAIIEHDLIPILCIGEQLEDREAGKTEKVIDSQLNAALKDVPTDWMEKIVIAYEPVWAIGTGKTASPGQAQEVHKFIREKIGREYNPNLAEETTILYGGSVKPDNSDALFAEKDIDGFLIGGASLKADSFEQIARSASS